MSKDVTLLEEIAEQDLAQVNGGTGNPALWSVIEKGNLGWVCTATKECLCFW